MSKKSQYEKKIKTLYSDAYKCIDKNFVLALDALHIPHIYGNIIADLPESVPPNLISYIIKRSLRDLQQYELTGIYLITDSLAPSKPDFFIVTRQTLPESLTDKEQLLNQWRREEQQLAAAINVIFCDEMNYLARKDVCTGSKCEAELNTGVKCRKSHCICFPYLAHHQGFPLLFINVND
ncbi:hypothetical protein [Thalassomonas actiniarum]|uniref:Uncharacterized protein n=1 Tax=Thalassomonas actiniarum TaxID=485447 RepID=A0AAE9YZW2_9GAMM|nr:hypothetical protein [Thalassomonas actiniarum]WDE02672.1 hypothetical protein SG35_030185 [Thalassomonas actiniarum]